MRTIMILGVIAVVFIALATSQMQTGNCTWRVQTNPNIQFTYGEITEQKIPYNELLIIFNEETQLVIPIIMNETDLELSNQLLSIRDPTRSCTWIEYWKPSLSIQGKDIKQTVVILSGQKQISFESRIWRNQNIGRVDNANTTRPSIGGLG